MFGAGYVGLVTGACFAELGHHVVVRDIVAEKIDASGAGEVPIYEPGLDELIERNRERLSFTTDVDEAIDGAEFVYVAVGTPPTYSGDADLSAVWTVIDELPEVDQKVVVCMKSTVPSARERRCGIASTRAGLARRLRLEPRVHRRGHRGARLHGARPDRGRRLRRRRRRCGRGAARRNRRAVVRADVASAEMIKLAANAALMTRISFINEIANVCEATGADVVKVAEGIGRDRRIGKSFLRAGIGFGGSCFPKDSLALKQLAANSGYHFQVLNAVIEVNELQKRRVIGKLKQLLGSLRGKRVALLGLAFKPNTDDTREAPAFVLAGRLLSEGADVVVWDPWRERRLHGVVQVETRRGGRRAGPTPPCSSPSGRSSPTSTGRASPRDAQRRPDRRAEHAGPATRCARPGSQYDAIGRAATNGRLMEAIVLAGGKAERLGDAAGGLPKSLVPVGGRPLLAWQIGRLRAAGVDRVIVSCLGGQEHEFESGLGDVGVELVCAGEPERLGRGGGIRFAAGVAPATGRRPRDER